MGANYSEIQELLQQKADIQARLNLMPYDGDPECEGEVKYSTGGAATRCLIEDEEFISDKCIYCGKPAKHMAYWGKSY